MPTFKLYEALGLQRGASGDQIKSAYKKLAIQNHPDKGGDVEKFKAISAAYNVLSNEEKKQEYDQIGDDGPQSQSQGHPHHFNPHDIFAHMFGGGGGGFPFHGGRFPQQQRRSTHREGSKRRDHSHDVHIPLHEAYFGAHKGIKVQLEKVCFACKDTCPACQGLGNITQLLRNGPFTQIIQQACDVCSGTGNISRGSSKCSVCGGKCKYGEDKRVDIQIKPGVPSKGFRTTVDGAGEQAGTSSDTPGDLHINVVVNEVDNDGNVQRYGSSGEHLLLINKSLTTLTLSESILGKKIFVPHFTGKVAVDTRSFGIVQPGKEYVVKGKGMPVLKPASSAASVAYGDLIIKFEVTYPLERILTDAEHDTLTSAFEILNADNNQTN